jgi:hypothetical protein
MTIDIVPYEAVGRLRFGMNRDDVVGILGEPRIVSMRPEGEVRLIYEDRQFTVGPKGLVEVGLLPEASVSIMGVNVFGDPKSFINICDLDTEPKEILGFIVFLNLGITMTGFHDRDESQKAVTAFARGRWDASRAQMTPFRFR